MGTGLVLFTLFWFLCVHYILFGFVLMFRLLRHRTVQTLLMNRD